MWKMLLITRHWAPFFPQYGSNSFCSPESRFQVAFFGLFFPSSSLNNSPPTQPTDSPPPFLFPVPIYPTLFPLIITHVRSTSVIHHRLNSSFFFFPRLPFRIKQIFFFFFLTDSCQNQQSCPNRNKISSGGQRSGKRRGEGCVNGNRKGRDEALHCVDLYKRLDAAGGRQWTTTGRKKEKAHKVGLLVSRVCGTKEHKQKHAHKQSGSGSVYTKGTTAIHVCVFFTLTSAVNPHGTIYLLYIPWSYSCAVERLWTNTKNLYLLFCWHHQPPSAPYNLRSAKFLIAINRFQFHLHVKNSVIFFMSRHFLCPYECKAILTRVS